LQEPDEADDDQDRAKNLQRRSHFA
jgi:hypothetical protein